MLEYESVDYDGYCNEYNRTTVNSKDNQFDQSIIIGHTTNKLFIRVV